MKQSTINWWNIYGRNSINELDRKGIDLRKGIEAGIQVIG